MSFIERETVFCRFWGDQLDVCDFPVAFGGSGITISLLRRTMGVVVVVTK